MADSLPPIDTSLLPASVRNAGPEAQKLYQTALSFESVLTQQLAKALTSTLQPDDSGSEDGESTSDATTTMMSQLLPDALTRSLTGAGGLGLAQQLYEALGGTTSTDAASTDAAAKDGSAS